MHAQARHLYLRVCLLGHRCSGRLSSAAPLLHSTPLPPPTLLCRLNNEGQLGAAGPVTSATPVPVQTDLLFSDISAGGAFTCGVQA